MPRIVITGDTTITGIVRSLRARTSGSTPAWEVIDAGFNTWMRDLIDPTSAVHVEQPDYVGFIFSPRMLTAWGVGNPDSITRRRRSTRG